MTTHRQIFTYACRKGTRKLSLLLLPLFVLACGGDAGTDEPEADAAVTDAGATEEMGDAELLNPNLATASELEAAGLSPDAIAAITEARPFTGVSDLHTALAGAVGEEEALAAYANVWLPINLNDATTEEILMIPGVGDRMAYEFEEYRPYTSMDQFRREIGKYVDDDEVARLERYVTLNIS